MADRSSARPFRFLLRPRNRVGPSRVTSLYFVTSLRPLDKTLDRGSHPASDADCTCRATRAYPRPGAAHVPRGRLPAQRLRRVFGAPPAGAPLSLHAAWQPKVQVLTCACPLASRAACRPHEPSVQSALFRSSVAALVASRSSRYFARSSKSLRARAASASRLPGPGIGSTPPVPGRTHSPWATRRLISLSHGWPRANLH